MIATILGTLVVLCLLYYIFARKKHGFLPDIPGPTPSFMIGNVNQNFRKYHEAHQRWARQYGPIVKYFIGLSPVVLVSDPELVKEITQTNSASFINRARPAITITKNAKGLLALRDDDWRRVRKTIAPTFNSNHLRLMMPLVNQSSDLFLTELQKKHDGKQLFDIHSELTKLTLEIIGQTAFGTSFECLGKQENHLAQAASDVFKNISIGGAMLVARMVPRFVLPAATTFLRRFPPKKFARAIHGIEVLGAQANKIVDQRRANPNEHESDFVNLLINAKHDGNALSDQEIRDNCITFLLAGHETTANTLAYCIYLLSQHKDVENKMVDEINSIFGKNGKPETYEQLKSCHYIEMVINESLRLFPPAAVIARDTAEDVQIGTYSIPKDVEIQIPIYTIHHDANNWPEPERFDPERFRAFEPNAQSKLIFLPFGNGPRACIGLRFALMEAKMILARIYQKYTIKLADGQVPLDLTPGITTFPTYGIKVTVEPRV